MGMNESQKAFVKKIGNASVKLYSKSKILPSLTIAQAILESNWGKSDLGCYNYFGMKWHKGSKYGYVVKKTREVVNGKSIYVNAKFLKFTSVEQGIQGRFEFLNTKRYANLKGIKDYKTACETIKADGYATDPNYAKSLINIIELYDLDSYDKKALGTSTSSKPSTTTKKVYYTVKKGDTVSGIAKAKKTTIANIQKLNNLKDVNKIYVGQKLRIK